MEDYILITAGGLMILCAVYLAIFTPKAESIVVSFMIVGFVCCVMASYKGLIPSVKGLGWEVSFQQTQKTIIDLNKDTIGPMQLEIEKLKDAQVIQKELNEVLTNKLNSNNPASPLAQPSVYSPPAVAEQNKTYSVIIFYRDSRRSERPSRNCSAGLEIRQIDGISRETPFPLKAPHVDARDPSAA